MRFIGASSRAALCVAPRTMPRVALRAAQRRFRTGALAAALLVTVAGCFLTRLSGTAHAQASASLQESHAAPITIAVRVEIEATGPDGRVTLEPATSAVPGDLLLYTVTFTNTADEPLDRVRITQAVPAGAAYVQSTAVAPGAAVLYSTDGGVTFGLPAELTIANADGTRRAAAAGDYTHVRWLLAAPLDAAASGHARFRARLR